MTRKIKELRPVMTRIPEGLRRQLELSARRSGRSMNAEIIHRLKQSFAGDAPSMEEILARIREIIKAEKS
jgi:plasmid stability protein